MTFPDGGRSYLSKFYDDNWMIQYGFMERRAPAPTVARGDPLPRDGEDGGVPELVVVDAHKKVGAAIDLMQRYGISQLPVVRHEPVDGADRRRRLDPGAEPARPCLPEPRRAERRRRRRDAAAARGRGRGRVGRRGVRRADRLGRRGRRRPRAGSPSRSSRGRICSSFSPPSGRRSRPRRLRSACPRAAPSRRPRRRSALRRRASPARAARRGAARRARRRRAG